MRRNISLSVVVLVSIALTCGCNSSNKDKSNNTVSLHGDNSGKNATPDAFESSGDPPINANTRYAAGQLAESEGQPDRAIAQYREALKADPNHRDAAFHLAALLMAQRQFPQAIEAWQNYIQITKQAPKAYNDLALCYEASGDLPKAEETYKTCIARDPVHSPCRVDYGLMLARHDRIDDAVAQLSAVLKPAEVSYNLGSVFKEQGKIAQAKAYYQKALQQDPSMQIAQQQLDSLNRGPTAPAR